jgi:hypothetical protein
VSVSFTLFSEKKYLSINKHEMVYEDISGDLPRSFKYQLRKLSSGFYKQLIKIQPDRTFAAQNDTISLKFPVGSILNMNSLNIHMKGTPTSANTVFFPKYTSTLIKRLSVSVNGVTVQIINDYNLIYNVMANHNSFNLTTAFGQNVESSIKFTEAAASGATEGVITGTNKLVNTTTPTANERLCINHFLGVISGGSTPVWNTDALGEVILSIQFSDASVLCGGAEATALTYGDATYSLTDIYATVEAYSFSDDSVYTMLTQEDKKIGFNDFIISRFASVSKSAGINVTTYINASSLDYVIGTGLSDAGVSASVKRMVAYSAGSTGATSGVAGASVATAGINLYTYLTNPAQYGSDGAGGVDGVFTCEQMRFPLQYITSSTFYLNNRMINYGPLDQLEIFQNNLLALGYENLDLSANGFNKSIVSLFHYYKHYGACFQSFELINPDVFYLSGMNTQGSSVSLQWNATFDPACTFTINPILIAKTSRIMEVRSGRQVAVI